MNHPFDLLRGIPVPTSLSRLDDGTIVDVNTAYLAMFGVVTTDVLGRLPSDADIMVESSIRARLFDRLRAGEAFTGHEMEVATRTGMREVQVTSRVVDIDGVPLVLSTFVDFTEQRRNASAAQKTGEYMRELLAASVHQAFWVTDSENTRMLYVSPAYERIFGRTCASLYADARDWLQAVHADDRQRMSEFRVDPSLPEQRETYRVVAADDATRTIEITVFPVRDPSGAVLRVVGVAEDITERLHLEEQLRETQKLESLGLLAGGVAHDFNNILAVIGSNASMLAESLPKENPDRELVDEIEHAVQRAVGLTRQLLAFSRREVIEPVVVDLNAAVNDTRKMLRRMVGEDVVITTSLDPELGRVRIDPGYLVQVLMNLAVNARDAMPRGGTLTITTRNTRPAGEVMIAVTDTGCGMPPEIRNRVFEPLFTTKGQGKGTGLGLSVVRGIIDQAGGRIEIESEVGVGTTLRMYLPADPAPAAQIASIAPAGAEGTEQLVVVDDDAHVRQSISRALRGRGYRVLEASSGEAALELLRTHSDVSLLVTDVVMPVMDGCQLVEQARARRPSLIVLYMTGYADDAVLHHGVDRADEAVIEKPFRGYVLAERVRRMIDSKV